MATSVHPTKSHRLRWLLFAATALVAVSLGWLMRSQWLPVAAKLFGTRSAPDPSAKEEEHAHEHGGEAASIALSDKALKNIGYRPVVVALKPFERTTTMPAIVAEKPGKTQIHMSAPLAGIVTEIYVVQGEAIEPGSKMFEVRLTHEELVTAQQDYLKTVESLDVVNREIARLQSLGEGVIAGKRILEQQYEKQKLEAALRAAEQALLLHGLSQDQIAEINKTRTLLRTLTVRAPAESHAGEGCPPNHSFHVQTLPVSKGQQVDSSQELAVLADHCQLYIEGRAFEDDAAHLREAERRGWGISATLIGKGVEETALKELKLLYLADSVDPESRAFHFYLQLPNEVILDRTTPDKHRFIEWKFKPGQRMELRVPIERWTDRIVLPIEAIVDEGAELYVYRQNGGKFERVPVHVEYRDNDWAVVANDGALFPGDVVAGKGAYQMHLALKNTSGGGIDPHAGHNH